MSWIGLVLLAVGVYLALRLAGALLKILMFVVALLGAYWIAAPHMGWPTVSELVYVLGPDFGGKRIEEVVRPSAIAERVADDVVDTVVERVLEPSPSQLPAGDPSQLPEADPPPDHAADAVEPLPEDMGDTHQD